MKWVLLLTVGVLIGVSFLPVDATQPTAFADPSFSRYFSRTAPAGQALLWGGSPLVSLVEPYSGALGNRRLVQYFDRGRMELDAATGEVTQGLLVREMTSGAVQLGDESFAPRSPAEIPILATSANGGVDAGPTYADFAAISLTPAENQTDDRNAVLSSWLLPGGEVVSSTPPAIANPVLYVSETGHNIPDVIAAWLAGDPFGSLTWQDALGLPISEAYWIKADGQDRLAQLFERRVVVYSPELAAGEQFTLTNAGRHYYRWRYGGEPGSGTGAQLASAGEPSTNSGLVLPQGYQVETVLTNATDIIDLAVAPDGRVLVVHASGTVTAIDADRTGETVLMSGLVRPVAVVSVDTTIYAVDSAGLHRYRDVDGDGSIDDVEPPISLPLDPTSVIAAAGPGGTLYVGGLEPGASSDLITLLRWDAANERFDRVPATFDADGAFTIDIGGSIWAADPSGELVRFSQDEPTQGMLSLEGLVAPTPTPADTSAEPRRVIRDLLLYAPDGTIGDPLSDMLALVSDPAGGRLVRLRPSNDTSSGVATATNQLSGAIVDFITGFGDPVAVVAGLDGCLYVADDGSGVLYRIRPPR